MSEEKFDGLLLGLLIGSYICEERAGNRSSDNAMAIMHYRTSAAMMVPQGKGLPSWRFQ